MLLPGAIANAFMSPITGRLFDKYGGRILAIIGLSIVIVTTYMFSQLSFDTSFTELSIQHAIRMFGLSMIMMPVSTNGLNQLPRQLYPHGTAMNNTLNQVSAAIGTAILVTFSTIRQNAYFRQFTKDLKLDGIEDTQLKELIGQFQIKSMLEGINDAFFLSAVIAVIGLVLAFFIKRGAPQIETNMEKS